MHTQKIVITGGPSTGKTAVIEKLEAKGYPCLHEVIRLMTLEKKAEEKEITFKSNPIVSVSDPMAFNNKILQARVDQHKVSDAMDADLVFFDRGVPDVLAYMDCFGQEYPKDYIDTCNNHQYDLIFIMPPWKEIYVSDNERLETFEESLLVHKSLVNSYEKLGYEVLTVPKDTIANRVTFILDHIKNQ